MKRTQDLRFIWMLCAAATVGFIWQQSTVPPVISAETSDAVSNIIVPIVGGPTSPVGSFVDRFIRKIAHFTEFAALGFFAEMFFRGRHTPYRTLLLLLLGLAVGICDELLQIFTGRGAAVTDVLIDFSGYLFAVGATWLAATLLLRLYQKRKAGAPSAS